MQEYEAYIKLLQQREYSVFIGLKRRIQYLEWWPEYDVNEFFTFVMDEGITATEIMWMVRAFAMDYSCVMGRIKGGDAIDYFERRNKNLFEMEAKMSEWSRNNKVKISFIVCCNDDSEFEEMKKWVEKLWRPEFVEIDILEVKKAKSLCSGYNEGMAASDAQYKVYLHQDVRILNPFFIYDVLSLFQSDRRVGMIGMVGSEQLPKSGVMWDVERVGAILEITFDTEKIAKTILENNKNEINHEVSLIDGFMMITSIDIRWNEEKITGWDFYDASHSIDFLLNGYRILVPKQKYPWCLHDFGQVDLTRYDDNRDAFLDAYSELFHV